MAETIPEIVLRLAREQLAVARDPADLAPLVFEQAPTSSPPLSKGGQGGSDELVPAESTAVLTDFVAGNPCPSTGAIPSANDAVGFGIEPPDRVQRRASSTGENFALIAAQSGPPDISLSSATTEDASLFSSPTGNQRHPPGPPLPEAGDVGELAAPPDTQTDTWMVHPIIERIGEHGRHMEEVINGLEQSLARLFASQAESYNRLRDRVLEHDRRWLEQSANRRAAFAP